MERQQRVQRTLGGFFSRTLGLGVQGIAGRRERQIRHESRVIAVAQDGQTSGGDEIQLLLFIDEQSVWRCEGRTRVGYQRACPIEQRHPWCTEDIDEYFLRTVLHKPGAVVAALVMAGQQSHQSGVGGGFAIEQPAPARIQSQPAVAGGDARPAGDCPLHPRFVGGGAQAGYLGWEARGSGSADTTSTMARVSSARSAVDITKGGMA